MNNLSKLWAVLFFVLILTLVTEISPLNWFEAQEQCRDRDGLTIERRKSDRSYWTGRYKRITPWIKIMGCFNDSFLSDIRTGMYINVTMWKKAVGICQETCQRKNTTVFAVKGAKCVCIKDVGTTFWSKSVNPSNCNFTCFNKTSAIYKSECGGDSYYNVFEFSSNISGSYYNYKDNKTCLSLQCSKSDIKFIPNLCTTPLSKVCQIKESSLKGTAGYWTTTMMDCKSANRSAYLFGDIDFQNAKIACNKTFYPQRVELNWIGVARQFYLNKDDGLKFVEEEKKLLLWCQTCNKTKCQFITCNANISHPEVCTRRNSIVQTSPSSPISLIHTKPMETKTPPNEPTTSISSYKTRYTTEEETISEQVSTSKTALRMGAEDNDSDHVIILAVIAVLGVVIISAAMLIFYLRRKRLRQSEAPQETTTEKPSNKTVCTEERKSSNNPYFVLEKNSQEISSRSQIITESPYNDTEEGEYDHLRDIRSRKDEEEDTYQHASVGIPDDVSDYDTMANSAVNKTPDEEGTYDHAHPMTNRNSDYGYNLTTHASLNDNPYDIAERK